MYDISNDMSLTTDASAVSKLSRLQSARSSGKYVSKNSLPNVHRDDSECSTVWTAQADLAAIAAVVAQQETQQPK